ncbi:hypothetical protein PRIC1_006652 [Phytophthora ramorum]|uniref:Elicitin n=1 Tax=Phytophthora ramorum TaxID=164328 RepID=Q2N0D1_PHYRM|nr:elicitin-like protein RAL12 [Phytophthora ramorum]KAH7463643.1 Elicitin Vex1 [Phytophthora ramorum]
MQTVSLVLLFFGLLVWVAPAANAAACNSTELEEALHPLYANPNYPVCVSNVGVALPFTSPPTTAQIAAMCASAACEALIAIAITLDLPDCEVVVDGVAYNVLLVRARRVQQCSSASLSSSITASVSSSEAGAETNTVD